MALRIGVNALYLIPGGVGGTEIYLRNLLVALAAIDPANEYFIFVNAETAGDLTAPGSNFTVVPVPVRAARRPLRILWEQTGLALAAAVRRLDVLFNPGFTAPLLSPCPSVTVFHDLQHKRHPEYFRWFDLPFWRVLLYWSAHLSRRLIAVSDATRDDLIRFYRLPESRIEVIGHGVEEEFFAIGQRRGAVASEKYVLCVSTLHPHKNLDALVRAFAALQSDRPEFRLVLAGLRGFHTLALETLIHKLGLEECVQLTGWIPRKDLYALYERAWAFVYPSRFEGFGMPLVEAMAAGVPTACSAISPLIEIAGTGALLFEPDDPAALETALRRIVVDEDLRRGLASAGPERAADFHWRAAAEQTLRVLRSAACQQ